MLIKKSSFFLYKSSDEPSSLPFGSNITFTSFFYCPIATIKGLDSVDYLLLYMQWDSCSFFICDHIKYSCLLTFCEDIYVVDYVIIILLKVEI